MAFESALPAPTNRYERVIHWPPGNRQEGNGAPGTADTPKYGFVSGYNPDALGRANFVFDGDNASSGAGGSFVMAPVDGIWATRCKQISGNFRSIGANQISARGPILSADLAPGFVGAPIHRVFWLSALLKIENVVDNPDDFTGLIMALTAVSVQTAWPSDGAIAGQVGGFGLVGDGAGGMQYRTYEQAPAFPGNVLTTTPAPSFQFGVWNTVEFEMIAAAPGRDGSVAAFVNGTEVASHSFATGDLPVYGTGPGGNPTTRFQPAVRCQDELWLSLGNMTVRQGRFTRRGLELTA